MSEEKRTEDGIVAFGEAQRVVYTSHGADEGVGGHIVVYRCR